MTEKKENRFTKLKFNFIHVVVIMLTFVWLGFSLGQEIIENKMMNVNHEWLQEVMDNEEQIPDRIPSEDIIFYDDKVVVKGSYMGACYYDTNSMLPLIDHGANGLYLPVNLDTELFVGDVVTYSIKGMKAKFVHRIIKISEDDKGIYYILKGDNTMKFDPLKVRQEQIDKVMVGIIW